MKKRRASTKLAEQATKRSLFSTSNILYALIVLSVIVIGLGVYQSGERTLSAQAAPAPIQAVKDGALVSPRPYYDFGTVSMRNGTVSTTYRIKNRGAAALPFDKIYTSCMCTTAELITASGRTQGPFGMPGHGPLKPATGQLAPGETALLKVVFDPAAHGPAGVGRIERVVTVETKGTAPLELGFVAMVRP